MSPTTPFKFKMAVVTGTRAEYGLLYWLMKEIQNDPDIQLQLIVTGMHLSPEFGLTYQLIEADGFKIDAKVEMLLSTDSAAGITKSVGLGMIGFADALQRLSPDILILLGDRFELLAAAQAALIQKIPLAHIHGGELSEGAIDDAIRHSITKMSHLHFVAAEIYQKRVIQLGEHPERVFNVGAPGLERIAKLKLLAQSELEKKINFQLGTQNFLVTYHPETIHSNENKSALIALFCALDHFPQAKLIFTKANADEMGRLINLEIDQYILKRNQRAISYVTLGDINYLSLLQFVDVVIGNSSSGLIEVPYFHKPTVNIGNRQLNRLRASSVINCQAKKNAIITAIERALSAEFQMTLKNMTSPYKQDNTANKIKNILKKTNLKKIIHKHFYDIQINLREFHEKKQNLHYS
ncbi:MAG TPA: UDP-N-acetylglucosamine 2-epimerase [Gammaproteobacteria bacterium]|nr:UDP-N-acetylglucosamine 2-epimerase [Gammaproteobacteria bacterium]